MTTDDQHRIIIQNSETGSKLPLSMNLLMYRQIILLHIAATHTGCENLFIKLLSNVTPLLEIGPCAPCVAVSKSNDSASNKRKISMAPDEPSETHKIV